MEPINSFPGYEFKFVDGETGKQNMYRGTNLGRGGYVYFEPGMYTNVALLDIQSLHPASIIALNKFGKYTERYKQIREARIAIKEHRLDDAKGMLNGILAKYLTDENEADQLAQALKLVLNSTYGYCSATFDNPFLDSRDSNNIVALRGALFMRTLQDEIVKRGFTVAHIKTDSVKVPNATPEIIEFIKEFAKPYGYVFEHEATYEKMCLINGSTYIAKYSDDNTINGKHTGKWVAVAAQFAQPYVFKTLFSKEPIEFEDLCEAKEVKTAMYLYLDEESADNSPGGYDAYRFIGKVGQFCPMKPGYGGGTLLRQGKDKDGNTTYSAVTGTKGYLWMESEMVKTLEKEEGIDKSYYTNLVDAAVATIEQYGDVNWFCGN